MESLHRIIVKTPNQKFDDVVVECHADLTVKKLKNHLSEVYPTKPKSVLQKLIYSGHLLKDEMKLKDIIDTDLKAHTFHIVCNGQNESSIITKERVDEVGMNESVQSLSDSSFGKMPNYCQADSNLCISCPEHKSLDQYVLQMHHYYSHWVRCQVQHCIIKDARSLSDWQSRKLTSNLRSCYPFCPKTKDNCQGNPVLQNMETLQEQSMQPEEIQLVNRDQPDNLPANDANPQQPVNAINAGGAMFDDDADENLDGRRDWLDWVHMVMRASVMLSILYFYSSTVKIIMICLLGFLIYLYQTGWLFHRRHVRDREAGEDINQVRGRDEQPNQNQEDNVFNDPGDASDRIPSQTDQADQAHRVEANNIFTIIYTFLTSFFTSLLPQGVQ